MTNVIANESRFKLTLKNEDNSHIIDSEILESILRNLREFINSSFSNIKKPELQPKLNVLALPASSFGIEFSVSTGTFDIDDDIKEIINTLNNTIIDVTTLNSDDLFDLVFKKKKYTPKQFKHFIDFTETIINSGYELTVTTTDQNQELIERKIKRNHKSKIIEAKDALSKQYKNINQQITVKATIASISSLKNYVTIKLEEDILIENYNPLKKDTNINGRYSDLMSQKFKNDKFTVRIPTTSYCTIQLEGTVDILTNEIIKPKITLIDF